MGYDFLMAEPTTHTAGSTKLSALARERGRGSISRIAEEVGCAQSLVTRWASGQRRPNRRWSGRLFELYGIAQSAWDEVIADTPSNAA